jgi:hypothetical protein
MEEKDLEKRVRLLEEKINSSPDIYMLRIKVNNLESKVNDLVRDFHNAMMDIHNLRIKSENIISLEGNLIATHHMISEMKIDLDMEIYSRRKNKKDTV